MTDAPRAPLGKVGRLIVRAARLGRLDNWSRGQGRKVGRLIGRAAREGRLANCSRGQAR